MERSSWPRECDECRVVKGHVIWLGNDNGDYVGVCAECIRIAGIILARAEKDAAKDQVPSPEGERK